MVLYETNIPHVYCVYEGVTINAINTNGNALLEDNTLLDEDYFYTVIDVIDENAHARKAVVKGINKRENSFKGHNIFFRNGKDFANKYDKVITDRQKRNMIRFARKNSGNKKVNYNRLKKQLAHEIDDNAENGVGGFYKSDTNVVGINKNKLKKYIRDRGNLSGSSLGRKIIEHELRHRAQYNHAKKLYGAQSTRNEIKVHNQYIGNNKYYRDPKEYDAYRFTSLYNYSDDPQESKIMTKKERINSLKEKDREKYKGRMQDVQDRDSDKERLERVAYSISHPKYSKKYSKHKYHDASRWID